MKLVTGILCTLTAAFTLIICGCKKDSKSDSAGSDDSKSSGSSAFSCKFSPKVGDDAEIALGLNLDLQKLAKIGKCFMDDALACVKEEVDKKQIAEGKEEYKKFIDDPFSKAPGDLVKFAEEVELRNVRVGWAVVSVGKITFAGGASMPETVPEMTLAITTDIDIEKVVACVEQLLAKDGENGFKIVEGTIVGEKAWQVIPKTPRGNQDFRDKNLEPCFTSLDGQLVLLASNRSAFRKCVGLYREGKGEGNLLRNFKPANGDTACLSVKDLGAIVRKLPSSKQNQIGGGMIPSRLLRGLKDMNLAFVADSGNAVAFSLKLGTASDEDADGLRAMVKALVNMAQNPHAGMPKLVADSLTRTKIAGTGNVFDVQFENILPLFAGIAVPNFLKYCASIRQAACISNMKQLQAASEQCLMSGKPITDANLFGADGFIRTKPTCPCGGEYIISTGKGLSQEYSISCPNAKTDPRYPHELK